MDDEDDDDAGDGDIDDDEDDDREEEEWSLVLAFAGTVVLCRTFVTFTAVVTIQAEEEDDEGREDFECERKETVIASHTVRNLVNS